MPPASYYQIAQASTAPDEIDLGNTLDMFERMAVKAHAGTKARDERLRYCFDLRSIIEGETNIPIDTAEPGELTVNHLSNASHGELVTALVRIDQHMARQSGTVAHYVQALERKVARKEALVVSYKRMYQTHLDEREIWRDRVDDLKHQNERLAARLKSIQKKHKRDLEAYLKYISHFDGLVGLEYQQRLLRCRISEIPGSSSDDKGPESSGGLAQDVTTSEDELSDESVTGEQVSSTPSSAFAAPQAGPSAAYGQRRRRRTRADFLRRASSHEGRHEIEAAVATGRSSP